MIAALSLALVSAPGAQGPPFQVLAGPAFETLAKRTDAACPDAHVRFFTPGDLDWEQETFEETLAASDKARFRTAIPRTPDGAPRSCANRDGLSCPVANNLAAIEKAGLMRRFAAFVCVTKPPR